MTIWTQAKHEEMRARLAGAGASRMVTYAVAAEEVADMLDEIERLQAAVTVLTTDIGSLRGDGP